jgi:hypothetical protein
VKPLVGDLVLNIICAYTPQICIDESIKRQLWERFDVLVSSVLISEKLFIRGDINEHLGSTKLGLDGLHVGI